MKLPAHNRYDYVPITRRPVYDWPEGKRLAVFFCNNIEHFAFGRGLGSDSTGADVAQNQRNYAWRDYGNRLLPPGFVAAQSQGAALFASARAGPRGAASG